MTDTTPRAWRVVLEKIESDLIEQRIGPGDRLPGERELAASLGVGRSSVREAIRVLEAMGLIRTQTGSGPTAGAIVISTPRGGLAQLVRLQLAAQGFPLDDVVDMRLLLEEWVVTHLAAGPETHDLSASRALLDAMDEESLSAEEFLALDAQFHLSLATASGNVVVEATMGGLRTAIESYITHGARGIDDWEPQVRQLREQHRAIVAAIDDGAPEAARAHMHAHITGYYETARRVRA